MTDRHTTIPARGPTGPLMLSAVVLAIAAGFSGAASAAAVSQTCSFNTAIPDFSGGVPGSVAVDCAIAATGLITDLNIDIVIEHTWQGDLAIRLERVGGGTVVPLIFRAGDSAQAGAIFGFSANNFGTLANPFVFDDQAAEFYDTAAPFGIGNVADPGIVDVGGNWRPYGSGGASSLGAYDGQDIFGTWRLVVSDNAGGDTGFIRQFSLHAQTRDPNQTPEPGSIALAGLALAGLAATRWRRKAKGRNHGT